MDDTQEQFSTFESGAKRSSVAIRFDLIPREALEALAARLTFGATKYGEHNWQKGISDPTFQRDAANHLMAHLLDYQLQGNSKEDNTGAIIANAAFLCYFEAKSAPAQQAMFDWLMRPVSEHAKPQSAAEILAATRPAEPVSQRIELDPAIVVGAEGVHLTDQSNGHKMLLEELPVAVTRFEIRMDTLLEWSQRIIAQAPDLDVCPQGVLQSAQILIERLVAQRDELQTELSLRTGKRKVVAVKPTLVKARIARAVKPAKKAPKRK